MTVIIVERFSPCVIVVFLVPTVVPKFFLTEFI